MESNAAGTKAATEVKAQIVGVEELLLSITAPGEALARSLLPILTGEEF